jgi:glycerol-3-phosphate dehydrogenase
MAGSSRDALWRELQDHPELPVLIAGGGINGAGLLRELSLNGVRAVLVERGDFCSATSAASSRLIHGGLRYLEYGEVGLVRESLRERNGLLRTAPHYVHPLPTTIPIYGWTGGLLAAALRFIGLRSRSSRRGGLLVKIGLSLYDAFSRQGRMMPPHRFISRETALGRHPALDPAITGAATYFDAWVNHPERLCLELILDSEPLGGRALNYVSLGAIDDRGATLRDELTRRTTSIQPRIIVNATGPWIDRTNATLHIETQFIRGTKGSHLVLNNPALAASLAGGMVFFENDDGRICLLLEFFGRVIIGTTDIPIEDPDAAVCDEQETEYLLESARRVFPRVSIEPSQIIFRFSGVRPLAASHAATPGEISRSHFCRISEPPTPKGAAVLSLAGGKWTTFRAFSEQVCDTILRRLKKPRLCSSAELAIGGGRAFPANSAKRESWIARLGARTGLPEPRLNQLVARYGTRAEEIAGFIVAGPDRPLDYVPGFSTREIAFLVRNERVVKLEDLVLRRTLLVLLGELSQSGLCELSVLTGAELGWEAGRIANEVSMVKATLAQRHGVTLR